MSDENNDILNLIAGAGTDDLRKPAPILEVIQKGSPQVDATHKDYATKRIDDASPGDIVLLSENRVVVFSKKKQSLEVTPLAIGKCYVEFKPKNSGGGFVAVHPLAITADRRYRKGDGTEEGQYKEFLGQNELSYTVTIFGLAKIDGVDTRVMLRMTSTQLKKARDLEKMISLFRWEGVKAQPPIFARPFKVTTVAEKNDKGGWFGWEFTPGTPLVLGKDNDRLKELHGEMQVALTARAESMAPRLTNTAPASPALAMQEGASDDEDKPF